MLNTLAFELQIPTQNPKVETTSITIPKPLHPTKPSVGVQEVIASAKTPNQSFSESPTGVRGRDSVPVVRGTGSWWLR